MTQQTPQTPQTPQAPQAPQAQQAYGETYAGALAESYQQNFVPAIGEPLARDLVATAKLEPGERVLDVACGTGVVTRLAAEQVGPTGSVAGLDINRGMLQVARAVTPAELGITWHEASADDMPVPDGAFDAVLCQMGLQFFDRKVEALREMRRALAPGGRVVLNLPGPTPAIFGPFGEGLARHISPEAAGFVDAVFSLHDEDEIRALTTEAGFGRVEIHSETVRRQLPPPADFLWGYIRSTPLAIAVDQADAGARAALEREVCEHWQAYRQNGGMRLEVRMTTAILRD